MESNQETLEKITKAVETMESEHDAIKKKPQTKKPSYLYCYKCAILCYPNSTDEWKFCPINREHISYSIDKTTLLSFILSGQQDKEMMTKHKLQYDLLKFVCELPIVPQFLIKSD